MVQVAGKLPAALPSLAAQARSEGFRHLDRLVADWASGTLRFERAGEVLLAAYQDADLVGVGGLTVEDQLADAFRMRRLYVEPSCRNRGVARQIVETLLQRVPIGTPAVTLNAGNPGAEEFWKKLRFVTHAGNGFTHIRYCESAHHP